MRTIQKPTEQVIRQFLEQQSNHGFSYPEVGFSKRNAVVNGYDNDLNRVQLGTGPKAFEAACEAIRTWKMFPGGWAQIEPAGAPIQKGVTLAMTVHLFGLYWLNACRIVYTLEEERRFGFAYGTLPSHIECGEELFSVEWLEDDTVWYVLKAFSHPRLWIVKMGYPVARRLQRRFVRESQAAMKGAVAEILAKKFPADLLA